MKAMKRQKAMKVLKHQKTARAVAMKAKGKPAQAKKPARKAIDAMKASMRHAWTQTDGTWARCQRCRFMGDIREELLPQRQICKRCDFEEYAWKQPGIEREMDTAAAKAAPKAAAKAAAKHAAAKAATKAAAKAAAAKAMPKAGP